MFCKGWFWSGSWESLSSCTHCVDCVVIHFDVQAIMQVLLGHGLMLACTLKRISGTAILVSYSYQLSSVTCYRIVKVQ